MKKFVSYMQILAIVMLTISGVFNYSPSTVKAADPIDLGTSGDFVILSEAGITNVPTSAITGNIGASPIAASTIEPTCPEVNGTVYGVDMSYAGGAPCFAGSAPDKTYVDNAVIDMGYAYTAASAPATPAGVGPFLNAGSPAGTLNGQTLVPGVYTWNTPVSITGDITLSGRMVEILRDPERVVFSPTGGSAHKRY